MDAVAVELQARALDWLPHEGDDVESKAAGQPFGTVGKSRPYTQA